MVGMGAAFLQGYMLTVAEAENLPDPKWAQLALKQGVSASRGP